MKLGKAEAKADVDNTVADADKGSGEQGRAKVELEIPADISGEQTLEITTDAGTKVSLPLTVAAAEKPAPEDKPDTPATDKGSSSDAPVGIIVGVIAAVLALIVPLALAFPIDSVLGPIALINQK